MALKTKNALAVVGTVRAARGVTALWVAAVAALALGAGEQPEARAFPPFAKQTGKPCSYCHVNPSGGGKRTAAGDYYKAKKTLAGFQPAGAAPKPKATPKPAPKPKKPAPKPTPKPKRGG